MSIELLEYSSKLSQQSNKDRLSIELDIGYFTWRVSHVCKDELHSNFDNSAGDCSFMHRYQLLTSMDSSRFATFFSRRLLQYHNCWTAFDYTPWVTHTIEWYTRILATWRYGVQPLLRLYRMIGPLHTQLNIEVSINLSVISISCRVFVMTTNRGADTDLRLQRRVFAFIFKMARMLSNMPSSIGQSLCIVSSRRNDTELRFSRHSVLLT